jgi:hypothetical protein
MGHGARKWQKTDREGISYHYHITVVKGHSVSFFLILGRPVVFAHLQGLETIYFYQIFAIQVYSTHTKFIFIIKI